MRAVAGTRWLGVLVLVSLAGSGVILLARLTDSGDVVLHLSTHLPLTAAAAAATPVLSGLLGIGLGLLAAHRRGWLDQTGRALAVTGVALCLLWAALMAGFWFALHFELLPVLANELTGRARLDVLSTLLTPILALSLGAALAISVHVRAAARSVSGQGFVATARLRGLSSTGPAIRQVLRRCLAAVLTVLLAELIVVGCGTLLLQAVYADVSDRERVPTLPAESLMLALGCALLGMVGIVVVALLTAATRRGTLPDPERAAGMASTGFRSTDLLDVRNLSIPPEGDRAHLPLAAITGSAGVNLTVPRGQALAIIDDETAGAVRLCRAIVGLLPPGTPVQSGSILFDGRELIGLPEREFRRLRGVEIALLASPSATRLNPDARVGRLLASILAGRADSTRARVRADAIELLGRVGLDESVFDSYPHQLSAAAAQRVLLAGAIALRPQLLIVIEPTQGLPADAGAGLLTVLDALRTELGFTLIAVSARADVVALCDRAAVMRAGAVVRYASASEILAASSV
jgi:ABC-type dipeptide/oligopeptide/nickel transport system ATPase component